MKKNIIFKPKTSRNLIEKKKINDPEILNKYLELLKNSRPIRKISILTNELKKSEIPFNLETLWTEKYSPKISNQIDNIFNNSNRFSLTQKELTQNLPNLFISNQLYNYLEKNGERIPKLLKKYIK